MNEQSQVTGVQSIPKSLRAAIPARKKSDQDVDPEQILRDVEQSLGKIPVKYGIFEGAFNLDGKTVAYAREKLSHLANIPTEAFAYLGDNHIEKSLEGETFISTTDKLEFIFDLGEDG